MKFLAAIFVVWLGIAASSARGAGATGPARPTTAPTTQAVAKVGRIEHAAIIEGSGLVASRRYPGVFWTHNDSGNPAEVFAITFDGRLIAGFSVDEKNQDWEDIAIDDAGRLYIADIGNNSGQRTQIVVHRLSEPDPGPLPKAGEARPPHPRPAPLKVSRSWKLKYPAKPFDAEAFFIHQEHGYLISKAIGRLAAIYRFPLAKPDGAVMLEHVVNLPVRSPVTAADLSADGRRLAVLTVTGLFDFIIEKDLASLADATPRITRLFGANQEACAYAPGGIFVTNEAGDVYFVSDDPAPLDNAPARPASGPAQ